MKTFTVVALLFIVAIAPSGFGQNSLDSNAPPAIRNTPVQGSGGGMAQSQSLRVLSPQVGSQISGSAVTARYQITQPGSTADPSPTFKLQMDSSDPVETLATEYSFTGLAPGGHTFSIELVDANHTPIAGSRAEVHFAVLAQPRPTAALSTLTTQAAK